MTLPPPPISEPRWGEAEAQALRLFLHGNVGQRFLQRLEFSRPLVNETRDGNRRRVLQDERSGFEQCILEICRLASSSIPADARDAQQATQATTAASVSGA
jgi:hypothetical protein